MKAVLAYHDKQVLPDGAIVELKIWRLPGSVAGRDHKFKYSLFYGRHGRRLVYYGDERGQADHGHIVGEERSRTFVSVEKLAENFKADVRQSRGES